MGLTRATKPATHSGLAEAAALARLGAPMATTQFFIMGMGFLDTAMAGHYASVHLAGVALGGNVLWPVFMLLAGCTMSITPITAQLVGAGRTDEVGAVARQGLLISTLTGALAILTVINATPLFALFGIDPEAAGVAARYIRGAAFGLPAVMCYVVLRYTSEGLGHTLGPMTIAGLALVLNGILNYAFIYGRLGAPELGGEGCGWATAIVMWFELGAMVMLSRARYFRATGLWSAGRGIPAPDWRQISRILKIGLPVGLAQFLGMGLFALIGFLVGSLGVIALAAHSVAGHINWATFVIPMSLGSAAAVRIGFYVGATDYPGAARVARVALVISLGYALTVSALLILLRQDVVTIYSDDPRVISLAATLILIIAIYQVFDDTQGTMAGALRGYKDTRAPMLYSLIGYYGIALPLGIGLGFGWWRLPDLGVYGFWLALSGGLAVVAVAMGARLYRTSGDHRRVARLAR